MSLAYRERERKTQRGERERPKERYQLLKCPSQADKYLIRKLRFSSNQCAIKIKLKFSKRSEVRREREVWETG